jgi:hypothetical protein
MFLHRYYEQPKWCSILHLIRSITFNNDLLDAALQHSLVNGLEIEKKKVYFKGKVLL